MLCGTFPTPTTNNWCLYLFTRGLEHSHALLTQPILLQTVSMMKEFLMALRVKYRLLDDHSRLGAAFGMKCGVEFVCAFALDYLRI